MEPIVWIESSEIITLEKAMKKMFGEVDIFTDCDVDLALDIVRKLGREGTWSEAAKEKLQTSDLRSKWNECFEARRSKYLAAWLSEHVVGTVCDVLAGDFRVAAELAVILDRPVAGCERDGYYHDQISTDLVRKTSLRDLVELAEIDAQTVILSVVLHHEPCGEAVLDALSKSKTQRLIIVENTVTNEFSNRLHYFSDLFFNRFLNEQPLYCGYTHRTEKDWTQLLSKYGDVVHVESKDVIPGVFLPHSLFVVEL